MDKNPGNPSFRPQELDPEANATGKGGVTPQEPEGFRHISGPRTISPVVSVPHHAEHPTHRKSPAEEARELLEEARAEADGIREAARRQGMEDGLREGRAQMAQKAARLEALLTELASYKPALFDQSKQEVLHLVCAMAERVLGPLSEQNPDSLAQIVERALLMLSDRAHVTVRVHPEDVATLQEAKADLAVSVDGIRQLTLVEDPSVPRGGAMVETESTEIDARLKTQLDELVRAVFASS